jgi:site-specific DNA-methyltransferase (adenine-specific)
MKPYYEHAGITIYHCDCREVLPHLQAVDAAISDPPYGIEIGTRNNQCSDSTHLHKGSFLSYDDTYENFLELLPALNKAIEISTCAAIFSGPHIHEQLKPVAIGGIFVPCATGRTPWGSKNLLPILFYGQPPAPGQHRATVLTSTVIAERNGHPTPKPISWLKWLTRLCSREGALILDPFMGSGTTLRAAKDLGRRAIGIEIEERYCEIAAKRLSQEVFSFEEVAQ